MSMDISLVATVGFKFNSICENSIHCADLTPAQNIGPQTVFPVPEGIINHRGGNSIAFIHWNLASDGGSLVQLSLNSTGVYQTGYGAISAVLQPAYSARAGAY